MRRSDWRDRHDAWAEGELEMAARMRAAGLTWAEVAEQMFIEGWQARTPHAHKMRQARARKGSK